MIISVEGIIILVEDMIISVEWMIISIEKEFISIETSRDINSGREAGQTDLPTLKRLPRTHHYSDLDEINCVGKLIHNPTTFILITFAESDGKKTLQIEQDKLAIIATPWQHHVTIQGENGEPPLHYKRSSTPAHFITNSHSIVHIFQSTIRASLLSRSSLHFRSLFCKQHSK